MQRKYADLVENWDVQEEAVIVKPQSSKKHWVLRFPLAALVFWMFALSLSFGGKDGVAISQLEITVFGFAVLISICYLLPRAARALPVLSLGSTARFFFFASTAFAALVILQLLPLTEELLSFISPRTAEAYRAVEAEYFFISHEPSKTLFQFLWMSCLAIVCFWFLSLPRETLSHRSARSRSKRESKKKTPLLREAQQTEQLANFLQSTLIALGTFCSILALGHWTLGAERLFGVFEISARTPFLDNARAHWPLLNPNHLAILLEVSLMLSLGRFFKFVRIESLRQGRLTERGALHFFLRAPERLNKQIWLVLSLLLMSLALVLTLSRAGNVLVLCGVAAIWFVTRRYEFSPSLRPLARSSRSRTRRPSSGLAKVLKQLSRLKTPLTFAVLILVGLIFLGESGRDLAAKRLEYGLSASFDDFRSALAAVSWEIFAMYPLFGVGLGCWSALATQLIPVEAAGWTLDYAHNDFLQLLSEGGMIAGSIVLACLYKLLMFNLRVWQQELLPSQRIEFASSFLALLLPLLHSCLSFPFHLPILSLVFVVTLIFHIRLGEYLIEQNKRTT